MVNGAFLDFINLPAIKVPIEFQGGVSAPLFIIDSGFSGFLKVNSETAKDLGMEESKLDVAHFRNANGERIPARLAYGFAELENQKKSIEIIVADGPELLGIGFMSTFGYKAIIDCKNWEARMEAAQ
jgi:predicted aspartyl protease